jgi:acetyltransferase-like isoleucine patch superfamily enzyme
MISEFKAKLVFRLQETFQKVFKERLRRWYWSAQGMRVGSGTRLARIYATWPHQTLLGANCKIEHGVYFHFDGLYKPGPSIVVGDDCFIGSNCEFNITTCLEIGSDCLIASGTVIVDHNHGLEPEELIRLQKGTSSPITIGKNVWIGANCIILQGVNIGDGAVIGAGTVLTKSVAEHTIVVGVPARVLRTRPSVQ